MKRLPKEKNEHSQIACFRFDARMCNALGLRASRNGNASANIHPTDRRAAAGRSTIYSQFKNGPLRPKGEYHAKRKYSLCQICPRQATSPG
jgi:hypothetical protein